ncbi:Killer cell lectin-like receptor subfamily G member 2 [Apodemus speciosus]|uniref:Killer cell lectin-like receptor subfamily G member 2 n=1 Tax=Apodemus speciosus TaxID=105296 RepID=A0ABQ0EV68_APOSI
MARKLPRAITLSGLPQYMKSLRWALVVMAVLLAVCTVATVALASRGGAKCQPCPQGWMWFQEHCYYLSEDVQDWEGSQAFCSAHYATLPLLSHTQLLLTETTPVICPVPPLTLIPLTSPSGYWPKHSARPPASIQIIFHGLQDLRKFQKITKGSWVGARRGPEGWHWTDGVPLPSQLIPGRH